MNLVIAMPPIFVLRRIMVAAAVGIFFFRAQASMAADDRLDYLRQLQRLGYGPVAVDYLEQLQAAGALPTELVEVFDLEMSKALRASAGWAYNRAERESRLARSQELLNKFVKEHPDHAAASDAMGSTGDLTFDEGLSTLGQARLAKDAGQKAELFIAARKHFEAARPQYTQTAQRLQARYEELAADRKAKSEEKNGRARRTARSEAEADAIFDAELAWMDAQFKLARVDYFVAQTYPQPAEKPQREESLKKAAKAFNDLFQRNRNREDVSLLISLFAHTMHGKCADELGQTDLALDIYDEVLSAEPDNANREKVSTQEQRLFSEVNLYRLLIVARKDGAVPFRQQAEYFLKFNAAWKQADGYQGIKLELAKSEIEAAEKSSGDKKLLRDAVLKLSEVAKVRGPHQSEAVFLLRQYRKSNSGGEPATFDEAFTLAEDAVAGREWESAVAAWTAAIALGEKVNLQKDKARLARARENLHYAELQTAVKRFQAGEPGEAAEQFERIAREFPDAAVAPVAASQAVKATVAQYAAAGGDDARQAALEKLSALAQYTIERWPDRAEADDARMALAQLSKVRGDFAGALVVFENVNPRSERFANARYLAAQTHWQMYLAERKKGARQRDSESMSGHLQAAEKQLQESLGSIRAKAKADGAAEAAAPMDPADVQLLLAEVLLEAGQGKEAIALVDPLVERIAAEKPESIDLATIRTFVAAVKGHLAAGDPVKAGAAAALLTQLGKDESQVNDVLTSFARLLNDEVKRGESAVKAANNPNQPNPAEAEGAQHAVDGAKQVLAGLLTQLAGRQNNALPRKIYIGITAAEIGQSELARTVYDQVLKQAEADPAFLKANDAIITRIRAELVGLERQQGKNEEALVQIDKLLAEKQNALPLLMERGHILESMAEKDPARYGEAIAHWIDLQNKLGRSGKRPPQYYQVVLSGARCLFAASQTALGTSEGKAKAAQALKMMASLTLLNPDLDGAQTVRAFNDLEDQIKAAWPVLAD